ncbi:alkanesulfonate transporter permease subunit [Halolamina pelagica]|uniref:Alkanesulfonate transporter permease subunit n=1 Tax=Halolamina pelagica TaxID=699431 RepID=A0A0P7I3U1_9EURY|nr:ABC transporter permease [Halolamina pelagica]KPN31642.1 alkanesulfonate transporter permease subunit [Halolamina pelagica]
MTARPGLAERLGPPVGLSVVLLGLWAVAAAATPPILLPTPSAVVDTVLAEPATFGRAVAVSGVTAIGGLALGTAVGLGLAFVAVGSTPGRAIVEPAVVGVRIAPLTAVAPLVLLWFGTGVPVRILLVSLMTTFPVTVASIDGLASPPPAYLELLASIGASEWQAFRAVRVPAALPSVFAGVKLGAALAVTGTVVAELLTLQSGLGAGVWEAGRFVRTAELFAYLLGIAAFGVTCYGVAAVLERAVTRRWGVRD